MNREGVKKLLVAELGRYRHERDPTAVYQLGLVDKELRRLCEKYSQGEIPKSKFDLSLKNNLEILDSLLSRFSNLLSQPVWGIQSPRESRYGKLVDFIKRTRNEITSYLSGEISTFKYL